MRFSNFITHGLSSHCLRRAARGAAALGMVALSTSGATVDAIYNSAADVPITAESYTASGNTVNFTLNFAPEPGTDLMVVNNTSLGFINGTFGNLGQGQRVGLSHGGTTCNFVANYFGGNGNDLMLLWADVRPFGWGYNYDGQLGNDGSADSLVPIPMTTTGVLAGKIVVALAAGEYHSLVLCSDGTLAACGFNESGQIGDNTTTRRRLLVAVNTDSGTSALHDKAVVAMAAGFEHSLALCSDGTVAAWGYNSEGQLGDGSYTNRLVPTAVNRAPGSALYGKTAVAIAACNDTSLALCSDGTLAAWGRNNYGQLGDGTISTGKSIPVTVNATAGSALSGKTVVAIAVASGHCLALCSDSTVAAWGGNDEGELGNNTNTQSSIPVAVNRDPGVSALYGKTVVAIAAGAWHSLALCSDGTVAAWGYNYYGQLGDNTWIDRWVPTPVNTTAAVSALYGKTAKAISAGAWHGLALCTDGLAAAWGDNGQGQLGDDSTMVREAPVLVNTGTLAPNERFAHLGSGAYAKHTLGLVAAPPAPPIRLTNPQMLNGSFQFTFTNTPGRSFSVWASTNLGLPSSNWSWLTGLTETSPGEFQFTDPQAGSLSKRFYRVSSP